MHISVKNLFYLFILVSTLFSIETTTIKIQDIKGKHYVSIGEMVGALGIEYKTSIKKKKIELRW